MHTFWLGIETHGIAVRKNGLLSLGIGMHGIAVRKNGLLSLGIETRGIVFCRNRDAWDSFLGVINGLLLRC